MVGKGETVNILVHACPPLQVQQITEPAVCSYHCPEGSVMYAEAVNTSILPNVKVQLKTFAPQVHSLLMTHDGHIPLMRYVCSITDINIFALIFTLFPIV